MKQKGIFLVSCLMVLVLIATPAFAASFEMDVNVLNQDTCPTIISGEQPLGKDDIQVSVSNWYQMPDTYEFTLGLPEGWSGAAHLTGAVDSGTTETLDAIWITVPETEPGEYDIILKAESGQTGDTVTESFTVNVLSCHSLELTVQEPRKSVCLETDTEAVYRVSLENRGKGRETFSLSAKANGQPANFVSFQYPRVTLEADETFTMDMTVNTQGLTQEQDITVEAVSEDSYASATETATLVVSDCYDFEASLNPSLEAVCLGDTADFTLSIDNKGKSDTFKIITPSWVKTQSDYVSIPGGQSGTVSLKASPGQPGQIDVEATIQSGRAPAASETVTSNLDVQDCREVAVIVSPTEDIVCQGTTAMYAVTVKNMGTITDTFEVTTSLGSLSSSQVMLDPGQSRSLKLTVDTEDLSGEKVIKLVARSDGSSDQTFANLGVDNCYSAEITMEPADVTVCPCSEVDYTVTLENTGEHPDTYTFTFGSQEEEISLKSGEKEEFEYTVSVSCDMLGSYVMGAGAVSDETEVEGISNLVVKSTEDCWSADLLTDGSAVLDVENSTSVPIAIRNRGEQPTTYNISVDGPDWIYVQPEEITLNYEQEKDIFLYVSPPMGTDSGKYTVTVKASSEHHTSEADVTVYVGMEPEQDGRNTTQVQPGVTPGIDFTGQMIGAIPAWKTMVVGLITIIIIMILVVRFAILFKD